MPAAHGVGEREHRVHRQLAGGLGARGLDAVEALGPVGERGVPALADVGDDRLDAAHASIRSTGTSRIDVAPARLEPGEEPPDVGGRDERVHGDHARLRERDDARRARAGDERADLLERGLGRVQHQVAGLARLDDAGEDRAQPERGVVGLLGGDQHGLGGEERPERAEPVRAQRVPAGDEVDDRVGQAEPRRHLDRAGDVDELDGDVALGEQAGGQVRIDGRHPQPGQLGEPGDGRFLRHRGLQRAAAEAEPQQLGHARAAFRHEVGAGDPAVDDAVLDVLGDVRGADEQHLDGRVPAREGERALAGLLGAEAGVLEQRDRRLAQAALGGDRDLQAVGERCVRRSSAVR